MMQSRMARRLADADVAAVEPAGNPMALGSAFHAACQWLIEVGADALPAERADALTRLWHLSAGSSAISFDVALDRWLKSAVRAELLAWPCIRAEVPFFSLGCEDEDIARYGAYAEGAIDALATNPAEFVTRAGHRLQDGRHTGRDAGTAAGEARPAGARLR